MSVFVELRLSVNEVGGIAYLFVELCLSVNEVDRDICRRRRVKPICWKFRRRLLSLRRSCVCLLLKLAQPFLGLQARG